ncbi:hypothetical protein EmuJ_000084900 [Echinococcus multilocularis]|uniref:Uncharacterized protein n=1 Tax=Echinococcus multilocularis TaxID=6211 RepID=A0A087VY18_ECHMU|nr:hypothetical protein EmuJ_000084900 [Echinococcus multilocularis]
MSPFGVSACRTVCLSSPSLMNGALLVHSGEAFLALLAVREELGRIRRIANCNRSAGSGVGPLTWLDLDGWMDESVKTITTAG